MSYYSFPAAPGMVPPPPMTSSNPMQPYPLLYSSGIVASAPPTGPTLPPPPPIPATTVFIGNIYERASDLMIKTMLQKCGRVINWKRVQGASGKLQAFGFCEYEDPESTLRCIRLLNGFLIGDQKLLVKVDQKTTTLLNEYRRARLKTDGTNELEEGEDDEDLTVVSNAMKADDEKILESLKSILVKYNRDLFVRSTSPIHSVDKRDGDDVPGDGSKLDDDANRMVAQSIRRFREQFRDDDDIRRDDKRRSPDQRNESKAGPPRRTYPQQRRSLPRQRRTPRVSEEPKEEDEDDETKERRRQERKLQEREAHYQAHLDRWQLREQRRQEYYRQEREHEINRRREHDRSRRCFLRYLDSYDDEKMDSKYYGGSMFTRKFKERQRELSEDARDRKREREEFAVLRRKHQISNDDGEDTIRNRSDFGSAETIIFF